MQTENQNLVFEVPSSPPEAQGQEHQESEDTTEHESKRRKTSKVWKDFQVISAKNYDDGKDRAKCKHCGTTYKAPSSYGTKNLKEHLLKCPTRYASSNPLQMLIDNSAKLGSGKQKIDLEIYKELMALIVIHHAYPFSWVEHKHVRKLLAYLNVDAKEICRNTVKNYCLKIHQREKDRIKKCLQNLPGKICLTCDIWTSAVTQGYLCLTAHYIDENWILQSRILSFCHVPPPHTARVLHNTIFDLLKGWGIQDKIFSITLDNARCNDNMQDLLCNTLNLEHPLPCNGDFFHVRCCAHVLNLIVQEGLKVIDESPKKLREGIKYLTGSEGRKISFQDCAKRVGCNMSKGLWLDCPTRWNSTYTMLERAVLYRHAFINFALEDRNYVWSLESEEWNRVEHICQLLEPFSEITTLFSGSQYPTANLYFKHVWAIELILRAEMKSNDPCVRVMAKNMKTKFDKYWDCYSLVLAFAVILDPRFKLDYVKYCYKKLDETTYLAKYENVRNCLESLYYEYSHNEDKAFESLGDASHGVVNFKKSLVPDEDFDEFEPSRLSRYGSKLHKYLEESRLPRSEPLDILDWWKKNEYQYPRLAAMARDILSIPITTVASESTFSKGGKVLTKLRGSLTPENAEALITTRSWLTGVDAIKDPEEDGMLGLEYQFNDGRDTTTRTCKSRGI